MHLAEMLSPPPLLFITPSPVFSRASLTRSRRIRRANRATAAGCGFYWPAPISPMRVNRHRTAGRRRSPTPQLASSRDVSTGLPKEKRREAEHQHARRLLRLRRRGRHLPPNRARRRLVGEEMHGGRRQRVRWQLRLRPPPLYLPPSARTRIRRQPSRPRRRRLPPPVRPGTSPSTIALFDK